MNLGWISTSNKEKEITTILKDKKKYLNNGPKIIKIIKNRNEAFRYEREKEKQLQNIFINI